MKTIFKIKMLTICSSLLISGTAQAGRFIEASGAWKGVLAIEPEHAVARRRREECDMALATM